MDEHAHESQQRGHACTARDERAHRRAQAREARIAHAEYVRGEVERAECEEHGRWDAVRKGNACMMSGDRADVQRDERAPVMSNECAHVMSGEHTPVTSEEHVCVTSVEHATVMNGEHAPVTSDERAHVTSEEGERVTSEERAPVMNDDPVTCEECEDNESYEEDGKPPEADVFRRRIREIQKQIENECGGNARGRLVPGARQRIWLHNERVAVLACGLAQWEHNKSLSRIRQIISDEPISTNGSVIYVRINLRTDDMYIGETDNWKQRVQDHYAATFKHSDCCKKQCRGCDEHTKYRKHRVVSPAEWIMIPIMSCADKKEAKRIEKQLIIRWKPTLNSDETPFWYLRGLYANQRKQPKLRRKTQAIKQQTTGKSRRQMYTEYEAEGQQNRDLAAILYRYVNKEVTVRVKVGNLDLTNWQRLRKRFGTSYLVIHQEEQQTVTTIGRCPPLKSETPFTIFVKPKEEEQAEHISETLKDMKETLAYIRRAEEGDLEFMWRVRNDVDKRKKFKFRKMIWDECERRYDNVIRAPIQIRLPYFPQICAQKLREFGRTMIDDQPWPAFLKAWHCSKLRIITESPKTIADILSNVTHAWENHRGCKCAKLRELLDQDQQTEGHVLFVGRNYTGPYKKVLHNCAGNVPQQSQWDLDRAWKFAFKTLPKGLCSEQVWQHAKIQCLQTVNIRKPQFVQNKQVYMLRKILKGMVIGPLDKNNGELWVCCPHLYDKALQKAYGEAAGYSVVQPIKMTAAVWKPEQADKLLRNMISTTNAGYKPGTDRDIVQLWKKVYYLRGWNKYATFDAKGSFNKPYVLFKAKNVTQLEKRRTAWAKIRPIAPATKHPMRRLLHLAGRAWSYVTANLPGEHFVINHGGEVPKFLQTAQAKLQGKGSLGFMIQDIESCFPNMPKDTIRFALRDITTMLKKQNKSGVRVPKHRDTETCIWTVQEPLRKTRQGTHTAANVDYDARYAYLSFETLLDIMEFVLDNTILQLPDGTLLKQDRGIPMGDPLSPGMTIGTCAWMEHEWMQTLTAQDKGRFCAKRYMDDILMIYAQDPRWDSTQFCHEFKASECYQKPLKLEDGDANTFLETRLFVRGNEFRYKLKNDNESDYKVWRYQHFHSHTPYAQKRALLTARLRKVQQMASDPDMLYQSGLAKVREFQAIRYPIPMLRAACNYLAASTGERTWLNVRDTL